MVAVRKSIVCEHVGVMGCAIKTMGEKVPTTGMLKNSFSATEKSGEKSTL